MTGLIENYIRRIEKLSSVRATVPTPGTNHVDNIWLNSDIYPGELSINLTAGSLYTTDGKSIIDLNKENVILSGLVLSKSTAGVDKLTVSSGSIRYNGISYYYASSGTDILLDPNTTSNPQLFFIYGVTTNGVYGNSSEGNLVLGLTCTSIYGTIDESGIFNSVSLSSNIPAAPGNSILLGTALLYPGSTGYDIWPVSVASIGDYYPKFSVTPSELLRNIVKSVGKFEYHSLYFPGQFIIDHNSSTAYIAKKLFVSDYVDISNDITSGNIVPIGASSTGGSGGSYSALSLSGGYDIYKTTVGSQFQFRSLTSSGPVTITSNANTLAIGLSMSGFVTGLTNTGTGEFIYSGLTSSTIAKLRSITGGSNVNVITSGDNIVISVPQIGSTAQGINLGVGASADIFAGMSGADLTFRRLLFGPGMSASQSSNLISIDAVGKVNNGVNSGGGPGIIYAGMTGDNLQFRSLTGGSNITVTTVGNLVTISSTGGGATYSGLNIGATGDTSGRIYKGMSGSALKFGSITSGYGIAITEQGNNIQIDSTVTDGPQGRQGLQGPQGFQGLKGFQGNQGWQGAAGTNGTNGINGSQGWQGPNSLGPQGAAGPQGNEGPAGISAATTPRRFNDVYDNTGGATVSASNYRYLNFKTTSPRANTDPVLFTYGTISQIAPNGTYFQVNEDGDYLFLYTITLQVPNLGSATGYLWDYTANQKVAGSDVYFKAQGGTEIITSTNTVALTGISSGNRYAIRIEAPIGLVGSISTILNGSSVYIEKMEIGLGYQGSLGFQGDYGPTGVQGFQGFQGNGPQGFQGPQGPQGTNGTIGVNGATGTQGLQGPQGFQGLQGPQGSQGIQGPQGFIGNTGSLGPQGFQGLRGVQGFTGPQGLVGAASSPSNTFQYQYSDNITASDPGSGYLRFNNLTFSSISEMYIDQNDAAAVDLSNFYASFAYYGNLTRKGTLKVQLSNDQNSYMLFTINSIDNLGGYYRLSLTYLSGSATYGYWVANNSLQVSYSLAGQDGTGSSFTYASTLFVDPNGDDTTASEGRLDLPWQTIAAAIAYCEDNLLDSYTIWVFPGMYSETFWSISRSTNITIKLNGGVRIVFSSHINYCINIESSCSIIGDDRAGINNVNSNYGGAIIEVDDGDTKNAMFRIVGNSFTKIKNIFINDNGATINRANFVLMGNSPTLHLVNSHVIANNSENIEILDCVLPYVAITNSILVTGNKKHLSGHYANINCTNSSDSENDWNNGLWNFENARFVCYGDPDIKFSKSHILSRSNTKNPMYVTFSNCKFWMNDKLLDALPVFWFDIGIDNTNMLEIIGTSLGNAYDIYDSAGTSLTYLGTSSFITPGIGIIDPTNIGI